MATDRPPLHYRLRSAVELRWPRGCRPARPASFSRCSPCALPMPCPSAPSSSPMSTFNPSSPPGSSPSGGKVVRGLLGYAVPVSHLASSTIWKWRKCILKHLEPAGMEDAIEDLSPSNPLCRHLPCSCSARSLPQPGRRPTSRAFDCSAKALPGCLCCGH